MEKIFDVLKHHINKILVAVIVAVISLGSFTIWKDYSTKTYSKNEKLPTFEIIYMSDDDQGQIEDAVNYDFYKSEIALYLNKNYKKLLSNGDSIYMFLDVGYKQGEDYNGTSLMDIKATIVPSKKVPTVNNIDYSKHFVLDTTYRYNSKTNKEFVWILGEKEIKK